MSYKRTADEVICEEYTYHKVARFEGMSRAQGYAPVYQPTYAPNHTTPYVYDEMMADSAASSASDGEYSSPPEAMMGESPQSVAMEVEVFTPQHRFITSFVTY